MDLKPSMWYILSLMKVQRMKKRGVMGFAANWRRVLSWSRPGWVFGAAFLCASVGMGFALWKSHGAALLAGSFEVPNVGVILRAEKDTYAHDELVACRLEAGSDSLTETLRRSTETFHVWVERNGERVVTVGEMKQARLRFDKDAGVWRALWPVPWNAPDGTYDLRMDTTTLPVGSGEVRLGAFHVASRSFEPVPAGFGVLTVEGMGSLSRFAGPQGGEPRLSAAAEWAEFIGADAVLIQGAESSGYTSKVSLSSPWHTRAKGPVADLARECHARGVRLGVYVLSFMVGGPPQYSPDYEYGWHYQGGRAVPGLELIKRRGVSIRDERRPSDIVNVLNHWAAVEGVDFLGLDYIRPVFGSQELVDDFVRDMPGVEKPDGFDSWSREQRMAWLGRVRYLAPRAEERGELRFRTTDQWFWYRAHRTAAVVRKIVEGFGGKKPLWAFTLSWQKGWEHGQDPAMMRDAGIDMNGIMLYEADGPQYRGLVRQWNDYTRNAPFNLVVGNTFDWRLHQKTLNPAGPEDMVNRILLAVERFQTDKPVRGIFLHDLPRALRGNIGPYPPKEWFLAGGSAITRVREIHGKVPYRMEVQVPDALPAGVNRSGTVTLSSGAGEDPVTVEIYSSTDLTVSTTRLTLSLKNPSAAFTVRWTPNDRSSLRGDRAFLALRSTRGESVRERAQIHVRYLQGQRGNASPAAPVALGREPGANP